MKRLLIASTAFALGLGAAVAQTIVVTPEASAEFKTYITNENDEIVGDPAYRVKKVHDVVLLPQQRTLFRDDDDGEDGDDNPVRGSWS